MGMTVSIDDGAVTTERDPRWLAVVARDRAADDRFRYSVRTTGVYCRPSCAARLANPENVRFHADNAAAEAAGFRPCKRCKPEQPPLEQLHAALAVAACRTIEAAETVPSLAALAKRAGLSPHHFHRVFKAATGLTPRDYAVAHRAKRMRDGLVETTRVTDAIYDAGFGSGSRFYEQSDAILGMSPTRYRDGGADAVIRFAVGETFLGPILVAASDKGVCAILMGDDAAQLVRDLQDRFPKARLIGGGTRISRRWWRKSSASWRCRDLGSTCRSTSGGTAFQQRVWQALTALPAGTTASYTDIARAIGLPKAVRAVAGACAANALAVAIPCHRVVRTDGALSGYRWGRRAQNARCSIARRSRQRDQPACQPGLAGPSTTRSTPTVGRLLPRAAHGGRMHGHR